MQLRNPAELEYWTCVTAGGVMSGEGLTSVSAPAGADARMPMAAARNVADLMMLPMIVAIHRNNLAPSICPPAGRSMSFL
jgi:hypothetical protein